MNLNDHPILMQGYDVIQAIEECGASVKLTNAVILAGELLDEINKLVGENKRANMEISKNTASTLFPLPNHIKQKM
jgi:hypothetical protein